MFSLRTAQAVLNNKTIDTFEFYPGEFDFVDGMYSTTFYLDDENILSNLADSILKEPYEYMSAVSFSSSDTNVVEIDKKGNVNAIAEGTAILKATCDDWSLELRVTVER
jgi:hypothetical protein